MGRRHGRDQRGAVRSSRRGVRDSRSPRTGARSTAAATMPRRSCGTCRGDRRLVRPFPVDPPFALPDTPRGIAVSPDGRTLALTHSDGAVDLIDTRDAAPPGEPAGAGRVRRRGRVQPRRTSARRRRREGPRHPLARPDARSGGRAARAAGRFPGARLLPRRKAARRGRQYRASALLRVWNVPRRALTAFRSKTLSASLAFSPDGELFAAAALDRGTEIRDAQQRQARQAAFRRRGSRARWPSPRTGACSRSGSTTAIGRLYSDRRAGSRSAARSRATRSGSPTSTSRRTAARWQPRAPTGRSGSGTWGPSSRSVRL